MRAFASRFPASSLLALFVFEMRENKIGSLPQVPHDQLAGFAGRLSFEGINDEEVRMELDVSSLHQWVLMVDERPDQKP